MEAALSVYEACYVRLQPFLLIDRTCRIFTAFGFHDRKRTLRVLRGLSEDE